MRWCYNREESNGYNLEDWESAILRPVVMRKGMELIKTRHLSVMTMKKTVTHVALGFAFKSIFFPNGNRAISNYYLKGRH